MNIIKNIHLLEKKIKELKKKKKVIGLVPTMGNLHNGHIKLILLAKKYVDIVIVSIFINPMQFNNLLDFKKYPKTFEQDCYILRKEKVEILFCPDIHEMYPHGLKNYTYVDVPKLSNIIEGRARPGHFIGVTTIICKLFNLVQPNFSFFGEKDYQQLLIVKKLVKELNYPIKIISLPTIRLENGLAFSSRNKHLNSLEQEKAPYLYKTIEHTCNVIIQNKGKKIPKTINISRQYLIKKGFYIDIFDVYNSKTLNPISKENKSIIILASVWLGNTRLIDNKKIILKN
ncbi:pantoate--beta-alanine ligase [Buchnera aphidicola (Rhopalosiphum padi)]|uniref:Pantothenate synthetase n=1 Tax=Buchnera aphidicola subsp. Rhopalosiphum padi TaxID=98793 RepID=A0A4D6YGM5_BUCRP|nr:pantoate--beta-alanine ligase [Buchnera aphidicola]QCI24848.1 pantoate--beta-alanine ligase [Buchnera aphidicola (Rhopalosiphum padi)]